MGLVCGAGVKLSPAILAFPNGASLVLDAPFLLQLPATVPGKAGRNSAIS